MGDWGLKIGIDGEMDFKRAITDINSNIRLLNSELKLSEVAFANNEKTLTEMTFATANSGINAEKLTDTIREIRKALEDNSGSLDASKNQIQTWATQLNNAEVRVAGISDEIGEMSVELGRLDDTENCAKNVGELGKQLKDSLSKGLSDAKEKAGNLWDKLKTGAEIIKHPISSFKNLWGEIKSGEMSIGSLGQTLSNKLSRFLNQSGDDAEEAADDVEELGDSAEESGEKSGGFADILKASLLSDVIMAGLKKLADLGRAIGQAFLDGAKFVINAGMEYESAFANVKKTMEGTAEELKAVSDGLREMSTEIPVSSSELAVLAAHAAQLGIQNDSILGFTKTVAGLGEATNLAGTQGAEMIASFTTITGMEQSNENFSRLGSSIVALGNNFATTEADIMAMGLRLSAAGSQVGMSEAEILGLATALSSVGVEAEAGGTALSKTLVKMHASTATYDELNGVLDQTGMTLRDLQMLQSHDAKGYGALAESIGMTKKELNLLIKSGVEMQGFSEVSGMTAAQFKHAFETDAAGALQAFISGLGNAEEKGETAVMMLNEMGLTEVRLRDSLLRAANATDLFASTQSVSNQAWEENNALTTEVEKRYSTLESKVGMLKNSVTDFGIALYQSSSEGLGSIVDLAKGYMTSLTEAFETGGLDALLEQVGVVLQDMINQILTKLPEIIPVVLEIFNKISLAVIENLPLIVEAATQILQALVDGLGQDFTPIFEAAFTLITSIIDTILQNLPLLIEVAFELILALATGIIQYLPELIPTILETVEGIVQMLLTNLPLLIQAAVELIKALAVGIIYAIPDLIPTILDLVNGIVEMLISNLPLIIEAAIEIVLALIFGIIEAIPRLVAEVPKLIFAIIDGIIGALPELIFAAGDIIMAIIDGIVKALPALILMVPDIVIAIVNGIIGSLSKLVEVGKRIVEGIWEGIKGMGEWLMQKCSEFIGGIVDGFKGFLGIQSPSRVFAEIGTFMALGLGEGFENEMENIAEEMEESVPTKFDITPDIGVFPNMSNPFSDIKKAAIPMDIKTGIDTVFGFHLSTVTARLDSISKILEGILGISGKQIVLNSGVLVGELAPEMEIALGSIARMKGR